MHFPTKADLVEAGQYAAAVVRHFVSFGWFVLAGALGVVSESCKAHPARLPHRLKNTM